MMTALTMAGLALLGLILLVAVAAVGAGLLLIYRAVRLALQSTKGKDSEQ